MKNPSPFTKSDYYDETFKNLDLEAEVLHSIEFDNCRFESCVFHETLVKSCRFRECSFENCDLSLLKIYDTTFNEIKIENSKAIGVDWSLCKEPFAINFYNSNITVSSFYKLNLKHSKIISCLAHEVDFCETNLEKVDFSDTDLFKAIFEHTKLYFTNLTTAKNYLINPSSNSLKKTKVSLDEATSFLKFLDLDITL